MMNIKSYFFIKNFYYLIIIINSINCIQIVTTLTSSNSTNGSISSSNELIATSNSTDSILILSKPIETNNSTNLFATTSTNHSKFLTFMDISEIKKLVSITIRIISIFAIDVITFFISFYICYTIMKSMIHFLKKLITCKYKEQLENTNTYIL
jgi:hypothetical protein